jgi:putative ABC transport system substrate-binding protein
MRRRVFLASTLATAVLPRTGSAQRPVRIARVGWLTAQQASSLTPFLDALRVGLADYGYEEGRNLAVEYRYGDDAIERVPDLAAELVRVPVEVLLVQGAAVSVISKLGLTVPVVYVFSGDPVSAGFADSLARPRANMTGVTFMAAEFNGKRLELLREIIPELRRVAIVANPQHPGEHLERAYSENAGRQLGLTIEYFPTRTQDELEKALATMSAHPPQAISLFADGFAIQNRQRIIDSAMKRGVPVISGWPVFAQSGALCTYGPLLAESYKRLAYYVDRILKGAKPAEIPIEQPTKFELVVNLKIVKALGLKVPPSVLARADRVIE